MYWIFEVLRWIGAVYAGLVQFLEQQVLYRL